jgi:hypothetical protein
VIGLSYPGHVSIAIKLKYCPNGSYVLYKNEKYFSCDPTYIGAKCGVFMPDLAHLVPEIIDFM